MKPTDTLKIEFSQTKSIKLNDKQLTEIIGMLSSERANNQNSLIKILYSLKSENIQDNFKHFDSFAKKSKQYDKEKIETIWNKCNVNKTCSQSYNTLIFYAKTDSPVKYNQFKKDNLTSHMGDEEDIYIKDNIIINQPYLLRNKKLEDDDVSKYIDKFLSTNKKVLFVKSPYDTGKTTFLKTITPKFEKVLFVSYRITLSENLLGNFPDFEIYYNSFMQEKIICQVDSLEKIAHNEYDLVIIDECESVLNHFSASSLKNQKDVFELFCLFLIKSKKIICLDGDLGNRSKKIFSAFGNTKLITNEVKKDTNHFILTPNETIFNDDIDKAIKENKNIVIVSMSDAKAKNLYNKYKDKYKTILYTSSTSDNQKKLLAQVEQIWTSHQVIIYSPSIESGVDFNVEDYIDNVYVVLCSHSTSQRGLNQMIKRVRKLKNKNVLVYTNALLLRDKSYLKYNYYTISEIVSFYGDIIGEHINFELIDGKLQYTNKSLKYNLYDILTVYNKQEQINKNPNCFIPLFLKMITEKGHTYEIVEEKRKKEKTDNIIHTIIKETETITQEEYSELMKKQKDRTLEEDEKNKIKKFIYERTFGIEFNDEETVKKYYGKLNVIRNAYILFNDNNIFKSSKLVKCEQEKRIKVVRSILEMFKLNDVKNSMVTLKKQDLENAIKPFDDLLQQNKILLGLSKTVKIEKTQGLLGSLRTILSNYGINIEVKGKNKEYMKYNISLDENVKSKVDDCLIASFMKDFNILA